MTCTAFSHMLNMGQVQSGMLQPPRHCAATCSLLLCTHTIGTQRAQSSQQLHAQVGCSRACSVAARPRFLHGVNLNKDSCQELPRTRCTADLYRPLVQRSSMSPRFTTMQLGSDTTSIQESPCLRHASAAIGPLLVSRSIESPSGQFRHGFWMLTRWPRDAWMACWLRANAIRAQLISSAFQQFSCSAVQHEGMWRVAHLICRPGAPSATAKSVSTP